MTEEEYEDFFNTATREQLIKHAVNLALDCDRLRRELDEANGVIR